MLEHSHKQIASDLLPRQYRKSRAFLQTVTVMKARSKIPNSNPSSNRKKGAKNIPKHQGIKERATRRKKIMFVVFVG
jgi:hypothetical protein